MKLIIQIPCYNEEENILNVLNSIPKNFKGMDELEIFVLDDGSLDNTKKIAQENNFKVFSYPHRGLSSIFKEGVELALKNNCDILVNLDGDNQYNASSIEKLIEPILKKEADITIGTRPIDKIKSFSFIKKKIQKFGSFMVKLIAQTKIEDAASGFRAFNKKSLLKLNIFNNFTYTIETIIQAKSKNLIIKNVKIDVNEQKNRKSKLFKTNFNYVLAQSINLIRFFIIYRPFKFFSFLAGILFTTGFILGLRFIYFYINHQGLGHVQSLILCSIILILSFILINIAIIGDLLSINRKILEEIQYKIRLNEYKK